jgi:hypothetical protein
MGHNGPPTRKSFKADRDPDSVADADAATI